MQIQSTLLRNATVNGIFISIGTVLDGHALQGIVLSKNLQTQLSRDFAHQIIRRYTGEQIELAKVQGVVIYVFPKTFEIIWCDGSEKYWQYMCKTPEPLIN